MAQRHRQGATFGAELSIDPCSARRHLRMIAPEPVIAEKVANGVASVSPAAVLAALLEGADLLILQPDFVICGERALDAERPPLDDHGL